MHSLTIGKSTNSKGTWCISCKNSECGCEGESGSWSRRLRCYERTPSADVWATATVRLWHLCHCSRTYCWLLLVKWACVVEKCCLVVWPVLLNLKWCLGRSVENTSNVISVGGRCKCPLCMLGQSSASIVGYVIVWCSCKLDVSMYRVRQKKLAP